MQKQSVSSQLKVLIYCSSNLLWILMSFMLRVSVEDLWCRGVDRARPASQCRGVGSSPAQAGSWKDDQAGL